MKELFNKIKSLVKPETVDPVRDEAKIFTVLLLAERFAVLASAIVSGFAVAAWGWIFAGGYWDNLIFKIGVAVTLLVAATYFTDVAIRYIVQKGAYDFFVFFRFKWTYNFRDEWFFRLMQVVSWSFLVAIGAGMFYFDYISVDAVRRPVAELVKQERTINADSLRRVVDGQEQARIAATKEAIIAISVDIRATERQIAAEKMRIVESFGKDGIKLYREKNGWFLKNRLEPKLNRSANYNSLNKQLETLRGNKSELEQQRTRDIAYRLQAITRTDSTANATNAAIAARNRDKVSSAEITMMSVGVWTKAGAMAIRVLLVALFLAYVRRDVNGDGVTNYQDVTAAAQQGFLGG
jgi:hypothetical protein